MSGSSKKPGVSIAMGGRLKPLQSTQVQNVFGDDESDEEKPQTSAEKAQAKYGNLKARDERAVKKVLEENPDIYDYDGAYESMQERRSRIEQEKQKSKTDTKPKYTEKLLEAKKKRDLEQLLRDERKQEKERKAEGDEFKDKDVFITGAYRKQIEEKVKFRKELEESDKIDEMTSVQGQKMWRENFGKKMLEDRLKDRYGDAKSEPEEDQQEVPDIKRAKLEEDDRRSSKHDRDDDRRSSKRDRDDDRRSSKYDRDDDRRSSKHSRDDDRRSSRRNRDDDRRSSKHDDRRSSRHSRDDDRRSSKHSRDDDRRSSKHSRDDDRRSSKRQREESPKKPSYKDAERAEQHKRMQAIRRILQQRNTPNDIEAARQRYFERRQAGLIVPPV